MKFLYIANRIFILLDIKNNGKLVIIESEDCIIDLTFKKDFRECEGVLVLE